MVNYMLIAIALLFGIARFFIPVHPVSAFGSYEAFAHLFIGGLIGAWLVSRKWVYLSLVLALTAVETFVFFTK
jgi:hypothetical protein